jgi:2,5-diketo-D-gluconate reductase A
VVPQIALNDGVGIPQLGFGTWQIEPDEAAGVVGTALDAGYRHIDTAAAYRNERGVGEAIRASGLSRDELFVTTKCWNSTQGYDEAKRALEKSLGRLELDFVDLYLIHWPAPSLGRYVDTWRALVETRDQGLARSIGVSNFQPEHLDRIVEDSGVTPSVNQIELHPRLQQRELREVHARRGIVTEAWSPLAQGELIGDPTIGRIAERLGRTPGQVILRWHLQMGNVVFPKSVTPARIVENFDLFSFELPDADVATIGGLEAGRRIGPDPDTFS